MRKKLLQNTLFAAVAAWALYLAHAQFTAPDLSNTLASAEWVRR
jgi:hypothetical protein